MGATVADAAARPLHWVYNQKKLSFYIKGKKDFSFLKKNKSPFYNIKTGKVSGYNEIGQVMFKTLQEGHENINERFKKNILIRVQNADLRQVVPLIRVEKNHR